MKNSRVGRMWEATREDEDAAEIMGVPTFKFKLLAFASGAFIGGLAGAMFAAKAGYINPTSFPRKSVDPVCRRGRYRWLGQPLGSDHRCRHRRLPARSASASLPTGACWLFGIALVAS